MSTRSRLRAAGLAALLAACASHAAGPQLGRPVDAQALQALDIGIAPDGSGLPPGSGDAAEGEVLYRARCLACHGEAGAGKPADRLSGGIGSLASAQPVKTVASFWPRAPILFDYIRRAMPLNAPRSLSDDAVYALCAYLLSIDGIVPRGQRLDATTLPAVRMPNRDGFIDRSDAR